MLIEGNFDSVYETPDRVAKVTPEQIREFAAKYLVAKNRTIINRVPVGKGRGSCREVRNEIAARCNLRVDCSRRRAHAQKEQPLPKELPPYGPQNPFQPPDVKTVKLDNGLTVWLVSRPGFPKVAFSISVDGGLAADPSDRPGLSELLAKTLGQGTATRSAKKIAEEIESAGGDLYITCHARPNFVTTNVLSSKTDAALAVLGDVLENASFPDSEVAVAKKNASDELRQNEAQPSFQANRALARVMFPGNPYSVVSPTQESLGLMTAAELRGEFARRFRPDHAVLVAVGDFEAAG